MSSHDRRFADPNSYRQRSGAPVGSSQPMDPSAAPYNPLVKEENKTAENVRTTSTRLEDDQSEKVLLEVDFKSTLQDVPGSSASTFESEVPSTMIRGLLETTQSFSHDHFDELADELAVYAKNEAKRIKKASFPKGVNFLFETFPVDAEDVTDGDSFTVYVNASNPDLSLLYEDVKEDVKAKVMDVKAKVDEAWVKRAEALDKRQSKEAAQHMKTIASYGYRLQEIHGKQVIGMPLKIRLRGIDAPESGQDYGKEAQAELTKIVAGNILSVLPYHQDKYFRWVADIYCDGEFVQKSMLENGSAWCYRYHDQRKILGEWEEEAKKKGIGLWAYPNPEEPWDWRRDNPRKPYLGGSS
uniref:Staphylococcal-like nuclease CAN2 n=1 Tax=Noccaea caerulescens TaxID=107243 RepID=A0A1J3CQL5_NOCCA